MRTMAKKNLTITIDPEILRGTHAFFGTQVAIENLFDYLESGDTIDGLLDGFDRVKREQGLLVLEMSQRLIETTSVAI